MASRRGRYEEIRIRSWDEYHRVLDDRRLEGWAFRGQRDHGWSLWSSLSRHLRDFGVRREVWEEQERRIIRIFRRKSHLFLPLLPAEDATFEWLALMEHHGAPTRLLDFSWSPYVAAFFALERATTDAAVWLLHPPTVAAAFEQTLRDAGVDPARATAWVPESFDEHFLPNRHRMVLIGEAFRMNQRLIAQSGTFATPGVLDEPMESLVPRDAVLKLRLETQRVRAEAMRDLYLMNMTSATLFPDLDGLSRSLAYELETHWAYDPTTLRPTPGFAAGGDNGKTRNGGGTP